MDVLASSLSERTNPDVDVIKYNLGMGSWSVSAYEAFERHIRDLHYHRTGVLWYGMRGMPKVKKKSWNSPL